MVFIELNDGRKINAVHISKIYREGKDIIYESAKGSLDSIKEHFDNESEAEEKENELKKSLLINS